eukprot:m.235261 g.235261  ORF g.235261 m.235261 type:complete len:308 (-) comp16041_c0_seq12:1400-2323(-)
MSEPQDDDEADPVVFSLGKSGYEADAPFFDIPSHPVKAIACGDMHSAFVTHTGLVFAFGSNEWGQLGLGHKNKVSEPSQVIALKDEMAKMISCGRNHTLVGTESQIYAFGCNSEGQLGNGDTADQINPMRVSISSKANEASSFGTLIGLASGAEHNAALSIDGSVFLWGSSEAGQLGLSKNSLVPRKLKRKGKFKQISCGYYHTALLEESGILYVSGEGESGQLGLSHKKDMSSFTKVPLREKVLRVACGKAHTIVLTGDFIAVSIRNIYCCIQRKTNCMDLEPTMLNNWVWTAANSTLILSKTSCE